MNRESQWACGVCAALWESTKYNRALFQKVQAAVIVLLLSQPARKVAREDNDGLNLSTEKMERVTTGHGNLRMIRECVVSISQMVFSPAEIQIRH